MDTFGLTNIVKDKTCFSKGHKSCIDIILTNRNRKFYICESFELGISDCHKLITTSLRVNLPRLRNKCVIYRSFKIFNKEQCLKKLKSALSNCDSVTDTNIIYDNLVDTIVTLLDEYAPLKKKNIKRQPKSLYEQITK